MNHPQPECYYQSPCKHEKNLMAEYQRGVSDTTARLKAELERELPSENMTPADKLTLVGQWYKKGHNEALLLVKEAINRVMK